MSELRKALVTGAVGGIGRAIARSLVSDGFLVVLADLDEAALKTLSHELGPRSWPVRLDITDDASISGMLDQIPDQFKPLDVLINNAGHHRGGGVKFNEGSIDDWSSIVETNLTGPMRVTRAFLPAMINANRGHIINVTSINALRIVPNMAPYAASKAGVHMLTDTLRAELAETDIRVTEINPGLTKTKIIRDRFRGDKAKEQAYFDRFRFALDPEDIARSVVFSLQQPPHVQVAQIVILPTDRS